MWLLPHEIRKNSKNPKIQNYKKKRIKQTKSGSDIENFQKLCQQSVAACPLHWSNLQLVLHKVNFECSFESHRLSVAQRLVHQDSAHLSVNAHRYTARSSLLRFEFANDELQCRQSTLRLHTLCSIVRSVKINGTLCAACQADMQIRLAFCMCFLLAVRLSVTVWSFCFKQSTDWSDCLTSVRPAFHFA